MATKRINLEVDEVSLCKEGANQGSKVALFKSMESDPMSDDLQKQLDAVIAERDVLKKQVEDLTKTPEPVEDKIAKLDPELKAIVEKAKADAENAQKVAKETAEALEKAQKTAMENELKVRIEKMKTLLAGDEKPGKLLKAVMDMSESARATVFEVLEQAETICAKSELFKEKGKDQPGDVTSAVAEVEKRAKEAMQKSNGMTIHQARVEVRKADPELAKREAAERKERK